VALVKYQDNIPANGHPSHLSTNRARRRATTLIKTNALPLSQSATWLALPVPNIQMRSQYFKNGSRNHDLNPVGEICHPLAGTCNDQYLKFEMPSFTRSKLKEGPKNLKIPSLNPDHAPFGDFCHPWAMLYRCTNFEFSIASPVSIYGGV